MKPFQVVLASAGAITAIVLLSVGGWYLHWTLAQANTNRQNHIDRSSFGFQQTLREEITNNLSTISSINVQVTEAGTDTAQALTAQKAAITQMVCQEASQVTGDPLPDNQIQFVQTNCPGAN